MKKYDVVISLGSECYTRSPYLKNQYGYVNNGIKYYPAFPFGSEKTYDFGNIMKIIDNDFKNYINKNKLLCSLVKLRICKAYIHNLIKYKY